ncbi:unnamed protein product [Candidula unifasciata]|uniref:Centromere protein J C-terminal domain-containing protein n=1 Tax=Candidula unifasciata TaxID=100452 RepID=A0A8S3ZVM5_9EUPU|nr:unnamed protein product [Candidula unifasciata]
MTEDSQKIKIFLETKTFWCLFSIKIGKLIICRLSSVTTANISSPPASKLMSKLFPKLKPKPSIEVEKVKHQSLQQASAQPLEMSHSLQSQSLREKLMKLDAEIEKFRSENANLDMLRREREEGLAKLKQEIDSFQRQKEDELRRLEEFKTEEVKKLKRERKLFDNYQKKIRSMPDKRDREEIDALKTQLQELQDELKHKESRWNASTARLKNRIAELEMENGELREEIRILEKKRLEWMMAQSSVKTVVQSNGRTASGESGGSRSNGATKQALPAHVRSSTPTAEVEKVKVCSSLGSKEGISSGANTGDLRPAVPSHTPATGNMTKNGKLGIRSNPTHKTLTGPQNGVITSVSKSSGSKHVAPPALANLSGEGIQNNSVPTMMETSLPVATQVSAMPGSLASSVTPSGKSAAILAMEHAAVDKGDVTAYTETRHQDGKIEKTYKTGAKEIQFPNGTLKEISADGQTVLCRLANGDIRQIFPDHRVVYIFAEAEIMQTTFPDGLETFQFKNGQIERRYPDGTVEITFPSKDVKYLFPDGGQEVILTDGTVMQYNTKGERIIEYPSGDREVHTAEYQRREFPDGIVKTVFSDGRHETRFPNGRIRLKDKAGNIIMDQIVYR